jgi:transposase-like protein
MFGQEGILKQLNKALIERAMEASNRRFALTGQPGYEKSGRGEKETANRRNGKTSKTLRTDRGPLEIDVPRDRAGAFDPRIIRKHRREWRGFDDKILSMYAFGMTTRDIQAHLKEIYAVDVSPELISRVTGEVKDLPAAWRSRPLDPFYPVVFLDALRINIREDSRVVKKAVYLALAIRMNGQKELGETRFLTGCG